jgi:hydroxymethylpyrimidine pyrophosphatase-like HAD family hydrolase
MKLSVLALDYDGTFTRDDRPNASVLAAVADARRRNITVILVTGRILDDLRRVAGNLRFVDAVVAENGAIPHFPGTGHTTVLAPPVPQAFVTRLGELAIPFRVGQCLVDADANPAQRMLDLIRDLELPIVLSFNRSRVTAMAQGVSKATGLGAALTVLRASARNTLAIGDAENDHELIRFAEVGVAVEWGSRALQAAADIVITGNDPSAVAVFIERTVAGGRLPIPARDRRRLLIGHTEDDCDFSPAVRGRNFASVVEELDDTEARDTCAAATSHDGLATSSAITRSRGNSRDTSGGPRKNTLERASRGSSGDRLPLRSGRRDQYGHGSRDRNRGVVTPLTRSRGPLGSFGSGAHNEDTDSHRRLIP